MNPRTQPLTELEAAHIATLAQRRRAIVLEEQLLQRDETSMVVGIAQRLNIKPGSFTVDAQKGLVMLDSPPQQLQSVR